MRDRIAVPFVVPGQRATILPGNSIPFRREAVGLRPNFGQDLDARPAVGRGLRPNAPWGEGPRKALERALSIADRLGLQTHDCDGIIGFADVPGEVEGQVATIAHLDVVPAGPGWDSNPFSLQKRENYLVGRGGAR